MCKLCHNKFALHLQYFQYNLKVKCVAARKSTGANKSVRTLEYNSARVAKQQIILCD